MSDTKHAVAGRLGLLTGASAMIGAIPLPVLPEQALLRLRGAIVHETASRHGLSLSSDARTALARPSHDQFRSLVRKGVELLALRLLRRAGPLGMFSATMTALEAYALGHLMDRYLNEIRRPGSIRILEPEAQRLRQAIDEAVNLTFASGTKPQPVRLNAGVEDLRDEFTRWIDSLLLGAASLPSYLQRRLDAAFDEVLKRSPELHQNS